MSRIFRPALNGAVRALIFALVVAVAAIGWASWEVENSPYVTRQQVTLEQPIPFSHEHHVGQLGIDCRYCHTSVATSDFAGMPSTKTCMTCHSQIWVNAPMLEAVRDSWRSNQPINWQRVNSLPEYVYFSHSIHVAKGVGCATCHGQVDQMPLMLQNASLEMRWCLDCHRAPEKYLRPRDQVFNLNYKAPDDQISLGKQLIEQYHVRSSQELSDCFTCHR